MLDNGPAAGYVAAKTEPERRYYRLPPSGQLEAMESIPRSSFSTTAAAKNLPTANF